LHFRFLICDFGFFSRMDGLGTGSENQERVAPSWSRLALEGERPREPRRGSILRRFRVLLSCFAWVFLLTARHERQRGGIEDQSVCTRKTLKRTQDEVCFVSLSHLCVPCVLCSYSSVRYSSINSSVRYSAFSVLISIVPSPRCGRGLSYLCGYTRRLAVSDPCGMCFTSASS